MPKKWLSGLVGKGSDAIEKSSVVLCDLCGSKGLAPFTQKVFRLVLALRNFQLAEHRFGWLSE
jgi:hypothetical protein